jgi:hypothetical protein
MTLTHTAGWLLIACGISLTASASTFGWQAYREHRKDNTFTIEYMWFSLIIIIAALAIAVAGYKITTA